MNPFLDLQVTVQSAQEFWANGVLQGVVPGYVQIDDVSDGENKWSMSPEKLREQGVHVPDFTRLPSGRYSWAEACGWLQMELEATT